MSKEAEKYWRENFQNDTLPLNEHNQIDNFKVMQSYAEHHFKKEMERKLSESEEEIKSMFGKVEDCFDREEEAAFYGKMQGAKEILEKIKEV